MPEISSHEISSYCIRSLVLKSGESEPLGIISFWGLLSSVLNKVLFPETPLWSNLYLARAHITTIFLLGTGKGKRKVKKINKYYFLKSVLLLDHNKSQERFIFSWNKILKGIPAKQQKFGTKFTNCINFLHKIRKFSAPNASSEKMGNVDTSGMFKPTLPNLSSKLKIYSVAPNFSNKSVAILYSESKLIKHWLQ